MISKEQYLEFELEDLSYLPSSERIIRQKPGWDDEETRTYSPRLVVSRASVSTLPTPKPLLEWPEFRELVEGWNEPIQRPILQMFVANNGPMSVARGIKQQLEFIRNGKKVPSEISPYILIDAYGTAFERLACYWLKIITEEPRKVLDVGSTQRVAQAFRRNSGIYIMPDGLIINNNYNPPLLEAACEYKTNPNNPRSNERLNRQVKELVDFFTRLGSKTLQAGERDNFHLDLRAHWTVKEIRIAARPSIILIIPQDREYQSLNEFVEVRKAPFSMDQLSSIVFTLLRDIHGIGLIEQELVLFEERRQRGLL